jgi:hypothetical protein
MEDVTMKFKIFQLKPEYPEKLFKRLMSDDIKLNHYNTVYESETTDVNLDEVFTRFNINRPDDFIGHSLSVSDIIQVTDGGTHLHIINFKIDGKRYYERFLDPIKTLEFKDELEAANIDFYEEIKYFYIPSGYYYCDSVGFKKIYPEI